MEPIHSALSFIVASALWWKYVTIFLHFKRIYTKIYVRYALINYFRIDSAKKWTGGVSAKKSGRTALSAKIAGAHTALEKGRAAITAKIADERAMSDINYK